MNQESNAGQNLEAVSATLHACNLYAETEDNLETHSKRLAGDGRSKSSRLKIQKGNPACREYQ